MRANNPSSYAQPSKYSLAHNSEAGVETRPAANASWIPKSQIPRPNGPYIPVETLNRYSESYMVIPSNFPDHKSPAKKNHTVVKCRILLLLVRICSWLGAAGLLVCVVLVRPIGSTMDWVIKAPPAATLLHLTYAIYHLSRSTEARSSASSATYMIFAAILDSCLMPLQVLVAFLARNQLSQALDDGTQAWTTLLETDFQRHTIIYSMYLLAIVTPSLHLVAFCLCIFLAIKFRRTSQLPIDVNPRGANPTSRGHKKAKSSVSILRTTSSHQYLEETSTKISSPLEPFVSTKTEPRASISSPNRRHNSNFIVSNHENTRASDIGRGRQSNKISYLASANQPRSSHTSRSIDSDLVRESEKWHVHPSILEHSHQRGPQELQHLRKQTLNHEYLRPAPLASISKYDFTKRSPRPLGLHPPTPREATPNSTNAFDTRALRDIDGNSSAPRVSNSVWDDINLELNSVDSSRVRIDTRKQYGDVVGMGRVMSSQARLVSSGVDTEVQSNSVRMREVSGKVVEEGRGRFIYRDF